MRSVREPMRALCGNVRGPSSAGPLRKRQRAHGGRTVHSHISESGSNGGPPIHIKEKHTNGIIKQLCLLNEKYRSFWYLNAFQRFVRGGSRLPLETETFEMFFVLLPPLMFLPLADAIHPHITQVTKNCLSHAQRSPGSCLSHAHQGTENGCVSGLEQISTECMRLLYTFM